MIPCPTRIFDFPFPPLLTISGSGTIQAHRLNRPVMFKQVFQAKKVLRHPCLIMRYSFPDQDERCRVGYIIRKRTGKAVLRNRIRRVLRQVFLARVPDFRKITWVVFELPPEPLGCTMRQLRRESERMLESIRA